MSTPRVGPPPPEAIATAIAAGLPAPSPPAPFSQHRAEARVLAAGVVGVAPPPPPPVDVPPQHSASLPRSVVSTVLSPEAPVEGEGLEAERVSHAETLRKLTRCEAEVAHLQSTVVLQEKAAGDAARSCQTLQARLDEAEAAQVTAERAAADAARHQAEAEHIASEAQYQLGEALAEIERLHRTPGLAAVAVFP